MSLRLISWNINSVRLRLPLLQRLAVETKADVIALQETKCPDEFLPLDALRGLGYPHLAYSGMKGYNGVLVMSKIPLAPHQVHDRCARNDCRHIEVDLLLPDRRITLHNLYIPAGGDVPDERVNDKFAHKMNFVRELTDWLPLRHTADEQAIAVGDFNIAPFEHDVWSHKQLLDIVSHTPHEVAHLHRLRETLDWVDVARHVTPHDEKMYTWWSYRNRDWRKSNRGRRLDHIWVTPNLTPAIGAFTVLQHIRDWPQPSDHVPIMLDLKL